MYATGEMHVGDELDFGFMFASKSGLNDGSSRDSGWLQARTLSASEWEFLEGDDTELVIIDDSHTTKEAKVWLRAMPASAGKTYQLQCQVTTADAIPLIKNCFLTITVKAG